MSAGKRVLSLIVALLYLGLVLSFLFSFVVVLVIGGIPSCILWMMVAPSLWQWLEGIVQFLEEKLL